MNGKYAVRQLVGFDKAAKDEVEFTQEEIETLVSALDTHRTTVLSYMQSSEQYISQERARLRTKYSRIADKLGRLLNGGEDEPKL